MPIRSAMPEACTADVSACRYRSGAAAAGSTGTRPYGRPSARLATTTSSRAVAGPMTHHPESRSRIREPGAAWATARPNRSSLAQKSRSSSERRAQNGIQSLTVSPGRAISGSAADVTSDDAAQEPYATHPDRTGPVRRKYPSSVAVGVNEGATPWTAAARSRRRRSSGPSTRSWRRSVGRAPDREEGRSVPATERDSAFMSTFRRPEGAMQRA